MPVCPSCNKTMMNIGGIGEAPSHICNNVNCADKFETLTCPSCTKRLVGSQIGVGHIQYACGGCAFKFDAPNRGLALGCPNQTCEGTMNMKKNKGAGYAFDCPECLDTLSVV